MSRSFYLLVAHDGGEDSSSRNIMLYESPTTAQKKCSYLNRLSRRLYKLATKLENSNPYDYCKNWEKYREYSRKNIIPKLEKILEVLHKADSEAFIVGDIYSVEEIECE